MTQAHGNVQFVDATIDMNGVQFYPTEAQQYTSDELLREKGTYPDVARIALNAWVLDGSFPIASAPYSYPLILGMSGADCTFEDEPTLTITFNEKHSVPGLTLYFSEDLPSFNVTYIQNGTAISSKNYTATTYEFFTAEPCEGFDEIVITFTATTQPYRAVMMYYILFGTNLEFGVDNIMSANLSEKVDVTGASIPYNTLSIKIEDSGNQMNPQNDNGLWRFIQSGQKVTAYETIDDKEVFLGTFYIDSWEYKDATATFDCISSIGLLDKYTYDGWNFNYSVAGATIMEGILDEAGFEDYEISDDIDTFVSGMLPRMSVRDALQQVAFACGAIVDDSRSDKIRIYKPDRNMDSTVGRNRKFQGKTSAELDEYINAVSITVTKYTQKTETTEVFKGVLSSGRHTIYFDEPIASPTGTNCDWHLSTPYMMWVEPTDPTTEVVINAYQFDTSNFTITDSVEAEPGQTPRTKEYSGLSVYNVALLPFMARNLLEYHRLRQTLEMSYLCDEEKVGEWVGVEDTVEAFKTAVTMIESQDIDLTGGFIAKAKCRGYSTVTTPLYEMGNEELNMEEDYII